MTNAQKIALRLSQVRQRLNEVAGLEGDAFTAEIRVEADGLYGPPRRIFRPGNARTRCRFG